MLCPHFVFEHTLGVSIIDIVKMSHYSFLGIMFPVLILDVWSLYEPFHQMGNISVPDYCNV